MMRTRSVRFIAIAVALSAIVAVFDSTIRGASKSLPDRLSDRSWIAATTSTANLVGIIARVVVFGDPLGRDSLMVTGRCWRLSSRSPPWHWCPRRSVRSGSCGKTLRTLRCVAVAHTKL